MMRHWMKSFHFEKAKQTQNLRNYTLKKRQDLIKTCIWKIGNSRFKRNTNVLGLAKMELIFPTATLMVLGFAWGARKVLITHQCLGKVLVEATARPADPNWSKGCSIPYYIHSTIKGRREEKGGEDTHIHICYLLHLSSRAAITCAEVLLPGKRLGHGK